jgi:ribonuclease G
MTEDILISNTGHETRVAIVSQGAVQELHIERASVQGYVGNVYLGKVARVLPGMQSAFITIGLERAAFLHVADMWETREAKQQGQAQPHIERLLFEGQTVMVQVIKDPIGTKGARLSTHISLAGRMLVYLPQEKHIGISQRIGDEEHREAVRAKLTAVMPAQMKGGFIIRTQAEDAAEAELADDIRYLQTTWTGIAEQSTQQPAPSLLHRDLSLAQRVLRDMINENTQSIRVENGGMIAPLQAFAQRYTPTVLDKIVAYTGERPLFDLHQVDEEIAKALSRRVDLKSGGYLMIDQTEAMCTIDVNTGGYVGSRNFEDTIFRTNLEAAHVIARQLRMRNLGGIILLDFIDMTDTAHKAQVLDELKRALARDRVRTTVSGFTSLGLVEMTRKRTRESLSHVLCEPCGVCGGKGHVKTAQTVCYEILRELEREARQFNPREFRIVASQTVIDRFLEEDSQHLACLEERVGKPIALSVETTFPQEGYDIVLM